MPTISGISATAKAGNHPACIAEMPTISSMNKGREGGVDNKGDQHAR